MEEEEEGFEIKSEPKIESKYLNNDQIERQEWEIIHIDVHISDKLRGKPIYGGFVTVRFAYKSDVRSGFIFYALRNKCNFNAAFPKFIQRSLISRIKEVMDDKPERKPREPKENTNNQTLKITQNKVLKITKNGANS